MFRIVTTGKCKLNHMTYLLKKHANILVRRAKIKNLIIPSVDKHPEILDHSHIFGGNIKW